jgi:integrase
MVEETLLKGDKTLRKWMEEFSKETTKKTYVCALNIFKRKLGIADLGEYLKASPDIVNDVRRFLTALNGKPSKTVTTYMGAIKMFLQDHEVKIPEDEWRKIRRRGFMPKRTKAETHDRKPTREELKKILNYADIKCRAMVLFLASSGARIGETLRLEKQDFKLDADPPSVDIKAEYTKGGVGGRTVYFSYEAKDAIKDWLQIKDQTQRRSGKGSYQGETVFPWKGSTAEFMWNRASGKASLSARDANTQRRVLHLHSLRKFFRSNIGLDDKIVNALMGHVEGLDAAYLRMDQEGEIAKAYKDAMQNVSVYNVEDQQVREQASKLEKENIELKGRIAKMESERTDLEGRMLNIEKIVKEMKESL